MNKRITLNKRPTFLYVIIVIFIFVLPSNIINPTLNEVSIRISCLRTQAFKNSLPTFGKIGQKIETKTQNIAKTDTVSVQNSEKKYVASKSGTKYYLPSCSGASRIKEENKVWFASVEEAKARGLEPASGCKGL